MIVIFIGKINKGVYLWCNKKFATILGLKDSNAIIDKTDYDLYSSELAKSVVETDKTILSQGKEYQVEEIGLDSENRKAIYLSIKTPIRDKFGKVEGLVGIS
ncbi:MAG: PAS domain-containing protein, partial [Gammaproteobacteria bacterium]